ncbi:Membrane protein involved in the export of O-antigen and teichoic acid [Pseudidiomarina maritima]|uniref:Membrane protein involved in the export of O-antigen and teichoic acid n=1 Tax=Pseudidiomarina maritima TaxID=519453 RepID=A0A1I6GS45_9GAMM|nr:oligosaccharide flippase family protein [Pseudidiomarina maritima]SFR45073.1 Membrane protein involved in the export of O-antigen and teichoic acid [Pseudidiomarina maritima]
MNLSNRLKGSFAAGAAIYMLSNIIVAAIPFILLPIMTRYLSPGEYGEVAMFQVLVGFFSSIVGLSVAGAANRKFYDNDQSKEQMAGFIATCFIVLFGSFVVTLFILAFFSNYLAHWLSIPEPYIFYSLIVSAGTMAINIRLGQWQIRKKASNYGAFQITQSLANGSLSLILVVVFAYGAFGRIGAQVAVIILFGLIAVALLLKDSLINLKHVKREYFSEVLNFGIPLIPHIAGIYLLSSIDRFVITTELGLEETGIYSVAAQAAGALMLIFTAINQAFVPWLFERLKQDNLQQNKFIVRTTYKWFAVILFGAALSFVAGPPLLIFLTGEKFARSGEIIGLLVLGNVFVGMYLMVTNYIFYSKQTGLLSTVTILSGLFNVILLLNFVKIWGLQGAALAFCIAMGVRFLFTWVVAQLKHPMPWFDFRN